MTRLLSEPVWESKIFDGEWVRGSADDRIVVEPATGKQLTTVGMATPDDVAAAATKAAAAQKDWAARPYTERAAVLRRAGQLFEQYADEIGEWVIREAGSIPAKAGLETHTAAEECYNAAALAAHPVGEVLRSEQPRLSFSRRVPVGTVGVIAPFNFPIILSIRAVAPALALGNSVILKPDPRTAICGGVVLARIFEEAGLPAGVLNVITTSQSAEVSAPVIRDHRLRKITFTGSTQVGRKLLEQSAERVLKTSMELGGNAPFLVFEDADIDAAVNGAMLAKMRNIGQACTAANRFIVHESVAAEFAEKFATKMGQLNLGRGVAEGTTCGPVITAKAQANLQRLVDVSKSEGAEVLVGGAAAEREGYFFEPTVLDNVDANSAIWREEIFGPIAPITRFKNEDEAVRLANDTEFGLVSYAFTADAKRQLRLVETLDTGMTGINSGLVSNAAAPFGGTKASGLGREGGAEGIHEYLETKYAFIPDPFA